MFDIGFWELVMIAVVALIVVGPRELPTLVRSVSSWMAHARAIASEFKNELSREAAQAEELKRLVERESEIAELHKMLDEARTRIPLDPLQDFNPLQDSDKDKPGAASGDGAAITRHDARHDDSDARSAPPGRDRDGQAS